MFRSILAGIVAAVCMPLPLHSQPLKIPPEFGEALVAVAGKFDNHYSFSQRQPLAYALSFEFADSIAKICPGKIPNEFERTRAQAYFSYIYSNTRNLGQPSFGTQGNWVDGAIILSKNMAVSGLPLTQARQRIMNFGVDRFASLWIEKIGGCGSELSSGFIENLVAIGTFGSIKHSDIKKTFIRREETDNGIGFVCYYDDNPNDTTEDSQGYRNLSALDAYSYGTPFNIFLDRILGGSTSGSGGTRVRPLMLRSDCPRTLDPEFRVTQQWVSPQEGIISSGATVGQRMAAYYIDVLAPRLRSRELAKKPSLPEPPAGYLEELRREIIVFEDLPLDRRLLQPRYKLYRSKHGGKFVDLVDKSVEYGITKYVFMRETIIEALKL